MPSTAPLSLPADFPNKPGVHQLRWWIQQVMAEKISVKDLVKGFRRTYESIDTLGALDYKSKEEARLIWDLLWALEFYSEDPSKEEDPAEWNDEKLILGEVKRIAQRLETV